MGEPYLQGAVRGVVGGCEPIVLVAVPEDFNIVEFGTVGRQKAQPEPAFGPAGLPPPDTGSAVNRGVFEHEHGLGQPPLTRVQAAQTTRFERTYFING